MMLVLSGMRRKYKHNKLVSRGELMSRVRVQEVEGVVPRLSTMVEVPKCATLTRHKVD